jgi:hypothetical protein
MTDIIKPLTIAEAEAVIKDRAATYVDEHGADHTLPEFIGWADGLRNDVGLPLDDDYLADVLFGMEQLSAVENGTHGSLRPDPSGIDDNTDQLRSWETELLARSIRYTLHDAVTKTPITGKAA